MFFFFFSSYKAPTLTTQSSSNKIVVIIFPLLLDHNLESLQFLPNKPVGITIKYKNNEHVDK